MSAVTAVIKDVKIVEGPQAAGLVGGKRLAAVIYCDNGATQVAGGTDTLDIVVQTALAGLLRSGQTFTVRSFAVHQCAQSSSTEYAGTITNSSGTLSLTPVTPAAWSSNATIAASAAVVPYGVYVLCDLS